MAVAVIDGGGDVSIPETIRESDADRKSRVVFH